MTQNDSGQNVLTENVIRKGIWQAVKTKTNYSLLDNDTATGGVFTDAIWLRNNYSNDVQNVYGKLITSTLNNNDSYITGNTYNTTLSSIITETVEANSDLGLANNTTLNKLPIADAKLLLMRLIYDDAKIYSLNNEKICEEAEKDFENQKLYLNAYDFIVIESNSIPINTNVSSPLYKDDSNNYLVYRFAKSGDDYTFTITQSYDNYTYYPKKILIKHLVGSERYTVSNGNITKIDNINLTSTIPIDFEITPKYEYIVATLSN